VESDEDILWKADVREKNEELGARGMKFIDWNMDSVDIIKLGAALKPSDS
ncbi:hypothetical protein FRX31_025203, partial [Thalictrum thalictroides]